MKLKNLDKYINQYVNADDLKRILKQYGLDLLLNRMLIAIEGLSAKKSLDVTTWAGTILTSINEKLRLISNKEDKEKLEYLLADLFQGFIDKVLIQSKNQELALSDIYRTLKSACDLNGYDFDKLASILGLNKHKHIIKLPVSIAKKYYTWNKGLSELQELASDVKRMRWIRSSSEFRKLCTGDGQLKELVVLEKGKEMLLILFDILYRKRIIAVKGGKGHFTPLVQVAVGDNGNYLYEKNANKLHEALKRKRESYEKNIKEIEKLIRINIKNGYGQ